MLVPITAYSTKKRVKQQDYLMMWFGIEAVICLLLRIHTQWSKQQGNQLAIYGFCCKVHVETWTCNMCMWAGETCEYRRSRMSSTFELDFRIKNWLVK